MPKIDVAVAVAVAVAVEVEVEVAEAVEGQAWAANQTELPKTTQ